MAFMGAGTEPSSAVGTYWETSGAQAPHHAAAVEFDKVPLVARDRMVDTIMRKLEVSGGGILLAGRPGTGKTALIEHVARTLDDSVFLLQVRGSSIGARTDYGALRFLLGAAGEDEPQHPIFVFQKLSKLLHARSAGKTVVLLVDNAHLLDELAAVMIGLLIRSGQARAVIACNGVTTISADLVNLWKDGLLDLQQVEPFTLGEAGAWISAALKKNVSPLAVQLLCEHSGGSPLLLKTLVAEQIRQDILVEKDGAYVMAADVTSDGKALRDVLAAHLSRLTSGERDVLELLALSGGLPLEAVHKFATFKDLDLLLERGLVIRTGGTSTITVRNPVIAEILRREVPPGRSRQLQSLVKVSAAPGRTSSARLRTYASWTLATGSELEPGIALAAAEAANLVGDAGSALRFLAHIPDRQANPRAVLVEAGALLQLGQQMEADEVLEIFCSHTRNMPSPAMQVEFLLRRASLACIWKDSPREAEGYLKDIRSQLSELGSVPAAPAGIRRHLADELTLAEAVVSSYQGRYTASIPALTALYVDGRGASEELRLRAGGLLAEALAIIGRQDDAVRVAEEVTEKMAVPELTTPVGAELRKRFFSTYLAAGMWDQCRDLAECAPGLSPSLGLQVRGLDVLGVGLMEAYAGRAHLALEALEPVIAQLRLLRAESALGVALAAAAYCHALLGHQESRDLLAELSALPRSQACEFRAPREYFSTLAQAVVTPGPAATNEILRRADEEQLAGRVSHEMFFLQAAVRLGELGLASRLLAVARRCQGVLAEACQLLATGLMAENPELLLTAGEKARSFGNERFCRDAALAAQDIAVRTANKTAARRAHNVVAESERQLNGQNRRHAALARLECLTSREREIVELAANGASNKDIAQTLHVSVRTVEGHLYQAYTKLHITGRDLLQQMHQEAARNKAGA